MDDLHKMYLNGLIDAKIYGEKVIKKTIQLFEILNYEYIKMLGQGTFGSVLEIRNKHKNISIAAKIVLDDQVSKNEVNIWPLLKHENIVPVIAVQECKATHTCIFFTPLYKTSLDAMLKDFSFRQRENALETAVNWLGNIVNGLAYLHNQKWCHLDLKCNNVLISENGTASICDFGFVASTELPVTK